MSYVCNIFRANKRIDPRGRMALFREANCLKLLKTMDPIDRWRAVKAERSFCSAFCFCQAAKSYKRTVDAFAADAQKLASNRFFFDRFDLAAHSGGNGETPITLW
jgi:hypothetical protein